MLVYRSCSPFILRKCCTIGNSLMRAILIYLFMLKIILSLVSLTLMVVNMFTFTTLVSFIDINLILIFRKTHQILFPQSSFFERLYIQTLQPLLIWINGIIQHNTIHITCFNKLVSLRITKNVEILVGLHHMMK